MAKIQVTKQFNLDNLGEEWKGCFMKFHAFTISDVEKNKASIFAKTDKDKDPSPEETMERLNSIITLLSDKFIEGKVYDADEKKIVDMAKTDISQFPLEVLSEAIGFLSPKTAQTS